MAEGIPKPRAFARSPRSIRAGPQSHSCMHCLGIGDTSTLNTGVPLVHEALATGAAKAEHVFGHSDAVKPNWPRRCLDWLLAPNVKNSSLSTSAAHRTRIKPWSTFSCISTTAWKRLDIARLLLSLPVAILAGRSTTRQRCRPLPDPSRGPCSGHCRLAGP